MKPARIFAILVCMALLGTVPQDKLGFFAGIVVGLSVGAVGTLFLLSEGARQEEKAGKCATCGR